MAKPWLSPSITEYNQFSLWKIHMLDYWYGNGPSIKTYWWQVHTFQRWRTFCSSGTGTSEVVSCPSCHRLTAKRPRNKVDLFYFYYYKILSCCIFTTKTRTFIEKVQTLDFGERVSSVSTWRQQTQKTIYFLRLQSSKTPQKPSFGHMFSIFYLGFSLKVSMVTWFSIFPGNLSAATSNSKVVLNREVVLWILMGTNSFSGLCLLSSLVQLVKTFVVD